MRLFISILAAALLFGCAQKFDVVYKKAQEAFAAEKYVDCIDSAHLALANWRESDGTEKKAQAYELLGKAYHEIKKIDKASEAYSQAVELSNNTYDSAYKLGIIYLASNEPRFATKSFQDALRMRNDDPLALVGLGNAYYDLKKYKQARQIYQRVLDTSPGVNEAIEFMGYIDKKLSPKKKKRKRSR